MPAEEILGTVVGLLVSGALYWIGMKHGEWLQRDRSRPDRGLPQPTRPAPPMPDILPTRDWPQQSLLQRYLICCGEALQRPLTTDAATIDAIRSARYFLQRAEEELEKRAQPEQEKAP